MSKATVIGLGYVGLPLSLVMWSNGLEVYGLDVRANYIDALKLGDVKMSESYNGEPIQSVLKRAVASQKFHPTTNADEALGYDNQKIILTVGIPLEGKNATTKDLESALEVLGKRLRKGALVVARSTLIVGYTRSFIQPRLEQYSGLKAGVDFDLAFSSERMAENVAFEELVGMVTPVAGITPQATKRAAEFLREMGVRDVREASCPEAVEAAKVMENIARDVNIALANEYANFCTAFGLDTKEVLDLVRTHKRVGFLHHPGPGVGGHCLPQAIHYLKPAAESVRVGLPVIACARVANDNQPMHIAQLAANWLGAKGIKDGKVVLLGLAMKDFCTDARLSPAVDLAKALLELKQNVVCWDSYADLAGIDGLPTVVADLKDAVNGSNVVIIGTRQAPFPEKGLAPIELLSGVAAPSMLLDCRFAFDRMQAMAAGFDYFAL